MNVSAFSHIASNARVPRKHCSLLGIELPFQLLAKGEQCEVVLREPVVPQLEVFQPALKFLHTAVVSTTMLCKMRWLSAGFMELPLEFVDVAIIATSVLSQMRRLSP